MATPDLSLITPDVKKWTGVFLRQLVLKWNISAQGISVYKNVTQGILLPKISATGQPMPYREQDDTTGRGVTISDRTLMAYLAKYDYDVDVKKLHNTYLSQERDETFVKWVSMQIAKSMLANIQAITLYFGVYNAAGTGAIDICTGWGTIIAAEITATNLVPVTTGAITATNAVASCELVADSASIAMKQMAEEKPLYLYCSFGTFEKYCYDYRTRNGFRYDANAIDEIRLDNKNVILKKVSWMGTSGRLILTFEGNLCAGTNMEAIESHTSYRRNILEVREMFTIGCQIADLEVMRVNEQA